MVPSATPGRVVASPPAWLVAAALALVWLAVAPRTPDLAAQVYRTTLYAQDGFRVWDDFWYSGHHLPAYSLLFPPLGALLGARVVGVGAAVASTVLFERLARRHFGAERARWGTLWFAAASIADLCIGRVTYSLGITLGLASLVALQSRRPRTAFGLAVLCGAGSPVAGAFLGLAGAAATFTVPGHRRAGAAMGAAALGIVAAMTYAFPEGGRQPMSTFAIAAVVFGCAALLWVLPEEERTLRVGTVLYLVAGIAMFGLSTPMGSNVARLGATFGGPLLACALTSSGRLQRPGRRWLLALAVGLLAWQWWGPAREITISVGDPSTSAAYFAPLRSALAAQGGPEGRLEVPFTRSHWESVHLAGGRQGLPLARGWETQLDRRYNALFFTPKLDPEAYHRWLRRNAVSHVAVPDAPLDSSGKAEAALVLKGLPFLRPVWHNAHWRLYAVTDPRPLVSGPATLVSFGRDGFTVDAEHRGWALVRTHFSPYYSSTGAPACLSTAPGGWTRVFALGPGRIKVQAQFDAERLIDTAAVCSRTATPIKPE